MGQVVFIFLTVKTGYCFMPKAAITITNLGSNSTFNPLHRTVKTSDRIAVVFFGGGIIKNERQY